MRDSYQIGCDFIGRPAGFAGISAPAYFWARRTTYESPCWSRANTEKGTKSTEELYGNLLPAYIPRALYALQVYFSSCVFFPAANLYQSELAC